MAKFIESKDILKFWFDELGPEKWFSAGQEIDELISSRFKETLESSIRGELHYWRDSAFGRLAEVILLDQFSRNVFRNTPRAFSQDPMALALAQEAVRAKADQDLAAQKRTFLYMPYMHSESKVVHQEAMELFSQPGMDGALEFEIKHKKIIDRFGRYPHRNVILGRETSKEEAKFLKEPDSSF